MNTKEQKPVIIWVLQQNQITRHMVDFFLMLKSGISKLDIIFAIPEKDRDELKLLEPLLPKVFQLSRTDHGNTNDNFSRKKNLIKDLQYGDELNVWEVLLVDDFGAGALGETRIHMEPLTDVRGIILQIPTPLGSRQDEEMIFEAWVKWAHANGVFIAGYELLSLYTRWRLLPSVLDGIITNNDLSSQYLNRQNDIKGKTWQLPRYESRVFTMGPGNLWKQGLQTPYHTRFKLNIPGDKTILYLTHNVAMTYEYKRLLEEIQDAGDQIHLMLSIGADQLRGTYNHREIIEITCGNVLQRFHSYTFHDLAAPWEMVMADAVIGCSHNYAAMIAKANEIPCIIIDETVPEVDRGDFHIVGSYAVFKKHLRDILSVNGSLTDLTHILYEIANREHKKIDL